MADDLAAAKAAVPGEEMSRGRAFGAAPTAVQMSSGRVRVEHIGSSIANYPRVAVLAHHSTSSVVSRSFRALVTSMRASGYGVLVVSSAEVREHLDWRGLDLTGVTVVRKPNVGYDFGSWAVGLDLYPQLRRRDHVVLANDSLVGPFASLGPLLDAFDNTRADVWGLTETLQFSRHLQSYFLGFRGGVLQEPALDWFWRGVRHHDDKNQVIHRNEIGFGQLLAREGYAVDAAFPAGQVVAPGDNPTIAGWKALLDRGMPFVKREIVRRPDLVPDGACIPAELLARFGVDVGDWLT